LLVVAAILIGNAAYQAGNISGGILGLEGTFGDLSLSYGLGKLNGWSWLIGLLAFVLLYFGNYKIIERILVGLVVFMSLSFLVTAFLTRPNLMELIKGLLIPQIPDGSLLTVIALVGTTVVPYNLFLHSSLVREKWKGVAQLRAARKDTYLSIILGGIVSLAIIVCGASVDAPNISNAADLAQSIEPLYGTFSSTFLSMGLFAAGITSAITAPLAAAYVAKGCFGWKGTSKSPEFRMVWILVLLAGVLVSSFGLKPIEIIKFAQIANGILLPFVAVFLVWAVNQKSILGSHRNKPFTNVLAFIILLTTFLLGVFSFNKVFNLGLF